MHLLKLLIIQQIAGSGFDDCASKKWLDEIIEEQEDEEGSCTAKNARLFTGCSVLVAALSRTKYQRDHMDTKAWFQALPSTQRDYVFYFAEAKINMLHKAIDAMKCNSIAHKIIGYYSHYMLMASLEIDEESVKTHIIPFSTMGLNQKVLDETNFTKKQRRRAGFTVSWPETDIHGITEISAQMHGKAAYVIEYNRRRRDTSEDEDNSMIGLNTLIELETTLGRLKDEIKEARLEFKDTISKDNLKLQNLAIEITTNLGDQMQSSFRKLDSTNNKRLQKFQPANSTALITIIILQSFAIICLIFVIFKKNNAQNN